jgi:protein O-GlcNAc transferase
MEPSFITSPAQRHEEWIRQAWKLHMARRLREAAALYRAILRENPRHADALHLMGLIAKDKGNNRRAEKLIRAAIEASAIPVAAYHNNLGNLLRARRDSEASAHYEKALEVDPGYSDAWLNFASYEEMNENLSHAEALLRAAYDRFPDILRVAKDWTYFLMHHQRMALARIELEKVTVKFPQEAEFWSWLGIAYFEVGKRKESTVALLQALRLDPDNAAAKITLSQSQRSAPQDAEALLLEVVGKGRGDVQAFGALGNVYKDLGYIDLALDCYAKALQGRPSSKDHANFLYTLLYDPTQNDQEVADDHRLWGKTYATPLMPAQPVFDNDRISDRPLRIGYVDGHFWDHAVALFSLPMIQAHNRSQFELFFYSCGTERDWATEVFRGMATGWHDIKSLSDEAAADLVRQDKIDILVDLAGHIGGNRLLMFARKPAPVQVTYLGYQATTGMETMDYRLTDAIADPAGLTDTYYTEQLERLAPSFFVYRPSDYAPPVAPPPFENNGHITFGCLNNPGKCGETVVAVWAELLRAVPDARLLMLGPSAQDADPRVERLFEAQGISADRIRFVGHRPRPVYLQQYDRIDIGLDPFPFSGHTTTCDALWQGVQVVSLAGKTYAGRMSASTLTQARLPHLVADSPRSYVQIATRLARDRQALSTMRRNLRDHLRNAPILNAVSFTRSLERSYRGMWCRWCATHELKK